MRAVPGTGSVYLGKKKARGHVYEYWIAQITVPTEDGKRKYVTGSAPASLGEARAKKLAIERRNKKLAALLSGPEPIVRETRTPKISAYLDTWLDSYPPHKLNDDGRHKYRREFELHILPFYDPMLHQITTDDLRKLFYRTLPAKGRTPRSVYTAYRALGTMLRYATDKDDARHIAVNPMQGVSVQRPASRVTEGDDKWINRRVNMTRYLLVWLSDPTSPGNTYHHAYLRVLFMLLGLRRSELLGLEWACFHNLEKRGKATVTIRQQLKRRDGGIWYIHPETKNKKNRTILLPELWREAALAWRDNAARPKANEAWASDLVFLTPKGRHVDYNTHGKEWTDILTAYVNHRRAVKEPLDETYYFRPHALRHVTASLLFDEGVPLVESPIVV